MKKGIVIVAAAGFLYLFGGCGTQSDRADAASGADMVSAQLPAEETAELQSAETVSEADRAIQLYREFLAGVRKAEGIGIEELSTKEDDTDWHYTTKYAILDVTGDAIPELLVRTVREYTILTCEDGGLVMLPTEFDSTVNSCLLKDGGFLYWEYPGWINSYWYYYCHFTLDEFGNRVDDIRFEWKDNNENLICDEADEYLFASYSFTEEKWNEAYYTMEEWLEKTREYLYTDENGREQIRDKAEWQIYCENSSVVEGWMDTCPEMEWERFDDGYDVLAEGEELAPEIREAFLSRYGFTDAKPLYEYDGYYFASGNERREHRVELYFDKERDVVCGIMYWEQVTGGPFAAGIIADSTGEDTWMPQDPFSTLSEDGQTGEELVEDYSEEYRYDDAGRLLGFSSYGTIQTAEPGQYAYMYEPLIEIDYIYDEQGNLREKHSENNDLVFLSSGPLYCQYDESGRLVRCQQFLVHVTNSDYYIYLADDVLPAYGLHLLGGTIPSFTVYR